MPWVQARFILVCIRRPMTDLPSSVVAANGWQELAKHFSLMEHFTIPDQAFVSEVWFDSLSAENQEAVLEAGNKFSDA